MSSMLNLTPTSVLALLLMVPFAAWAVYSKRAQTAALTVLFVCMLFGPEEAVMKFPGIPPLGKRNIPYILLFLFGAMRWGPALARARIGRGFDLLILISMAAGWATWQTNLDPLVYGEYHVEHLPALVINDAFQYGFADVLSYGLPFVLGRALFRERKDLLELFHFMTIAALVQGVVVLIEGRLSPQMHRWVYGYMAHSDFLQTMRWGGYRPMGFMAHGLAFSLFICLSFFAALTLSGVGRPVRWIGAKWAARVLFVLIVACRSTGALVYSILLGPMLAFAKPKSQVRVAMILALFVSVYPALRAFDQFPTERAINGAVALFGVERAQSLQFRFENEELLLDKARERVWFGWGGQGRNLSYDTYLGKVITVADGQWIILLGMRGVVGMFAGLGLLVFPLLLVRRRLDRFSHPKDKQLIAGLTVICVTATLDLVPNGLFAFYPYFLSGALVGCLDEVTRAQNSWLPTKSKPSRVKPSELQVSVPPPPPGSPSIRPGPRFTTG